MNGRKIAVAPSAYSYPLLIKQLLHAPLAQTAQAPVESLAALCRSIAGMRAENSPNR